MQPGKPDPELLPPPSPSLAERVVGAVRRRASARDRAPGPERAAIGPRVAAAVGLLIAAGPLLTIVGAHALESRETAAAARLRAALGPGLAATRTAAEARAMLARAIERPTAGATLDALAAGLPADAALVRAERTGDGLLEIDILAPDPDRLRAELRRSRGLARMRDIGQRARDGAMIVSLREVAP